MSAIAAGTGTFFGSFCADKIGYTWAFASAGSFLIVYTLFYAFICGQGPIEDDPLPGSTEQNNEADEDPLI